MAFFFPLKFTLCGMKRVENFFSVLNDCILVKLHSVYLCYFYIGLFCRSGLLCPVLASCLK